MEHPGAARVPRGWAPWLVEMSVRFGSLGEAFRVAAHHGHTGRWVLGENVRQYLALSDGRRSDRSPDRISR